MAANKDDGPPQIIGMTLPGIEDYQTEFVEDSDDDSDLDDNRLHAHLSVANSKGMIRSSFQQAILPIAAMSSNRLTLSKSSKSLPPSVNIQRAGVILEEDALVDLQYGTHSPVQVARR